MDTVNQTTDRSSIPVPLTSPEFNREILLASPNPLIQGKDSIVSVEGSISNGNSEQLSRSNSPIITASQQRSNLSLIVNNRLAPIKSNEKRL